MAPTNYRIRLILPAVLIGLALVLFAVSVARTQENNADSSSIQFPVKELGNCQSETDCKSYCDKPGNIEACVAFAEKNNLMTSKEIDEAKKFIAAGGKGPGGCTSKNSCENYCNDANNISECVTFAEQNGLMPPEELEEAKKVKAALEKGAKLPGGCKNKKDCDAYCGASEHMEECITFAEAAGFIPPEELADAKKMIESIKRGVKPLPCSGKAECDSYCEKPENFEACISFAEAAGFVSADEAVMARKTGGKGPGDCRGKEECEAFCKNPENQETCFNFGKEHGLIPESDLKEMEEGKGKMKEGLSNAPPEVLECLANAFGSEFIEKLKTGTALPSRDMGDKMRGCFEKIGPSSGMPPGEGMQGGPREGSFVGPGGCKTPEECAAYCQTNPDECRDFKPSSGGEPGRLQEEAIPPRGEEMMPPKEGFRSLEGFRTPEGMVPPDGRIPAGGTEEYPSPDQYRQQYQQQYERQYQQYQQPPAGSFTPPPTGEFVPSPTTEPAAPLSPPQTEPAPQTLLQYSPFGVIVNFFLGR